MYKERFYREYTDGNDLTSITVIENESDLFVSADRDLTKEVKQYLKKYRNYVKEYGEKDINFIKSLSPVQVSEDAPVIIKHMAKVAKSFNIGPMASVAGAISQYVGKELLKHTDEIIVENGGDIFLKSNNPRKILIYAGDSLFSEKIALLISPEDTPIGICASAGKVGHSLSFGNADAVVVVSKDTLLADAAATAIGNIVKDTTDIDSAIQYGKKVKGIEGILIIIKDKMGAWGKINLVNP